MIVALMNASWDLPAAIEPFLREVRSALPRVRSPAIREQANDLLVRAFGSMKMERYYDACAAGLEARALLRGIEGSDRMEIAGRQLCVVVRRVYRQAPPGFERVGRMKGTT